MFEDTPNPTVGITELDLEDLADISIDEPRLDPALKIAFESVNAIIYGLRNTSLEQYRSEQSQEALLRRIEPISDFTGIGIESIQLAITDMKQLNVSQENAFIDGIRKIIDTVISWLIAARNWIIKLIRKLFNIKTEVKAKTDAAKSDVKDAVKQNKQQKQNPPDRIKCTLPDKCLLVFHTNTFVPRGGYRFNQQNVEKALNGVAENIKVVGGALAADLTLFLDKVSSINSELVIQASPAFKSAPSRAITTRSIATAGKHLTKLAADGFETIGFGLDILPLRKPSIHMKDKVVFTDVSFARKFESSTYFDLSLDIAKFDKTCDTINKNVNDAITALMLMESSLNDSKDYNKLTETLKNYRYDYRKGRAAQEEGGWDPQLELMQKNLESIEVIYELAGNAVDNLTKLSQFYARYAQLMTLIVSKTAQKYKEQTVQPTI